MTIFVCAHPKIIKSTFSFPELVPACKKKLIPFVHSLDIVNFKVQRPDWPHPFLILLNQKNSSQLLIFVNLYQHAKSEVDSSICSGEMVDLKILQSDSQKHFDLYLRNKIFPNIGSIQKHNE